MPPAIIFTLDGRPVPGCRNATVERARPGGTVAEALPRQSTPAASTADRLTPRRASRF